MNRTRWLNLSHTNYTVLKCIWIECRGYAIMSQELREWDSYRQKLLISVCFRQKRFHSIHKLWILRKLYQIKISCLTIKLINIESKIYRMKIYILNDNRRWCPSTNVFMVKMVRELIFVFVFYFWFFVCNISHLQLFFFLSWLLCLSMIAIISICLSTIQ